jgi:surface polysaccharide O-acyltransferase-like enzyme
MAGLERTTAANAYAQTSRALANLRAVFILILLSFHSCLAYLESTAAPAAAFDRAPYLWLAFPVVDERRFFGFDLYCAWVDVYVMALMFFLSGLFVAPSLARKGAARFAADRVRRLGAPFLFNVFVLAPIAIYPVFHRLQPKASLADYIAAYRQLPFLPNGPTWFLWLLLTMTIAVAALYAFAPIAFDALAAVATDARNRPKRFLLALVGAGIVAYLPLALAFGPFDWFESGLFSFQKSRPLLYFVFFLGGIAVGASGLGKGLLAPDAALVRGWRRLAVLSPMMLFAWMGLTGATLSFPGFAPLTMRIASALAYVAASVAGVTLLLAVVSRFCTHRISWLEPLSQNSLGIFALHYVPLVWMQYLMLGAPIPAFFKALIVFVGVLSSSLLVAGAMRRAAWTAFLIGEVRSEPTTPARPQRV